MAVIAVIARNYAPAPPACNRHSGAPQSNPVNEARPGLCP